MKGPLVQLLVLLMLSGLLAAEYTRKNVHQHQQVVDLLAVLLFLQSSLAMPMSESLMTSSH